LALATVALADGETNTEDPNQNWCYAGGPWGDGRCNAVDPDLNNWYWTCGYYRAAVFNNRMRDIDVPAMCFASSKEISREAAFSNPTGPVVTPTSTQVPTAEPTPDVTPEPTEEPPVGTLNPYYAWCINQQDGGVNTRVGVVTGEGTWMKLETILGTNWYYSDSDLFIITIEGQNLTEMPQGTVTVYYDYLGTPVNFGTAAAIACMAP
jgi:putative hemolysin